MITSCVSLHDNKTKEFTGIKKFIGQGTQQKLKIIEQ